VLKKIINGVMAGVCIALGGGVFLSCDIKYIGAALFAVALLCICIKGYSLFTGKVCYIADNPTKETFSVLLLGLLGNLIATVICGILLRFAVPAMGEKALTICTAKLEQTFLSALIRGIFCGILIYLAVDIFRQQKGTIGIVFCIPVFILSGYEHSIADMFYFAASGIVSMEAFGYLWTIILGNAVGGLLLPVLSKIGEKRDVCV